jgi:hypothetical protein
MLGRMVNISCRHAVVRMPDQSISRREAKGCMSRRRRSEHDPEGMSRGGGYNLGKALWTRIQFYVTYVWRFLVLQRPEPLIYGIALTDRQPNCRLPCFQHCRDMTWKEAVGPWRCMETRFRAGISAGGTDALARWESHLTEHRQANDWLFPCACIPNGP